MDNARERDFVKLSGADCDVLGICCQCSSTELTNNLCRPSESLEGHSKGHWYINDDLLVSWLLLSLNGIQVGTANMADVASHIQEADGGDLQ